MKFTVPSSEFLKALKQISGVIASSPALPILDNFMFDLSGDMLTITASDLHTTFVNVIEVQGEVDGSVCVMAKILVEALGALPDQPITFTVNTDTYGIEINATAKKGVYKMHGMRTDDFPRLPELTGSTSVTVSVDVIDRSISNTLFATSTDEAKKAMCGIYLDMNAEGFTFVSTDGHRLVKLTRTDVTTEDTASLVFPKKALSLLKNVLSASAAVVNIEFNQTHAKFTQGSLKLFCRLVDERYPSFENAIPKQNPYTLLVNAQELISSLKRISIFANRVSHQIRMKLDEAELQLFAQDIDFSNEANERIACNYSGEPMEIGFNARFLIDVLSVIDQEEAKFELSAPNRAVLVLPRDPEPNEKLLMLVMPVMINNYN